MYLMCYETMDNQSIELCSSNLDIRRLTELEVYTNVLFRYTHRPNIG